MDVLKQPFVVQIQLHNFFLKTGKDNETHTLWKQTHRQPI